MPVFMDVHHLDGGVSAGNVAGAHARDVDVQGARERRPGLAGNLLLPLD